MAKARRGKRAGGEALSTPSLHTWFVCCDQLHSRFSTQPPLAQSCYTSVLTVLPHEKLLFDFNTLTQDPCGQPGVAHFRTALFSLLLYLAGCPPFAASMRETVSDCAEIVQDFSRIAERSIPPRVLRSAKGIAILRVLKGGLLLSGTKRRIRARHKPRQRPHPFG